MVLLFSSKSKGKGGKTDVDKIGEQPQVESKHVLGEDFKM